MMQELGNIQEIEEEEIFDDELLDAEMLGISVEELREIKNSTFDSYEKTSIEEYNLYSFKKNDVDLIL